MGPEELRQRRHFTSIRQQILNPPNAVPDEGIDLKRRIGFVPIEKRPLEPPPPPKSNVISFDDKVLTARTIMKLVGRQCGVKVRDILGTCRAAAFLFPRQISYWLCCQYFPHRSLMHIGVIFGRDHTSIINGRDKIDHLLASTSEAAMYTRAFIENVRRDLDVIASNSRSTVPCLCQSDMARRPQEGLSQPSVHGLDQAGQWPLARAKTEVSD